MIRKLFFIFFALLLLAGLSVFAQSSHSEIENLLSADAVTYGQAVKLILDASEVLTAADSRQAFNYAKDQNWLTDDAAENDMIRMDTAAFLFMKAFNLDGGLFYRLTNKKAGFFSSRYAYRELVKLKAIQGKTTPNMSVSGDQLLFITGRILSYNENAGAAN